MAVKVQSVLDNLAPNFHKLIKYRADSMSVPCSNNLASVSTCLLTTKPDIDFGISRLKIVPEARIAKDKIVAALVNKYPRVSWNRELNILSVTSEPTVSWASIRRTVYGKDSVVTMQ